MTAPAPQRYVLGIAYRAGRDDAITKGLDGHRDFLTPAELEKAAWYFAAANPEVGIYHADGTTGHATIVESYIHRGDDYLMKAIDGADVLVKKGDWLVGALLDPVAWSLYEAGHITGWSPQGSATRLIRRDAQAPVAKAAQIIAAEGIEVTVTVRSAA